MDKYFNSQLETVSPSFDTGQFNDVELVGSLQHFEKNRKTIIFSLGVGGSILSVVPPFVGEGKILFGACDKKIYCLDLDGNELWRFQTDDIILSAPTLQEGTVYAGSYDGNLYALDAETGHLKWKFHTNGKIIGRAVIHKGKVIIGSQDGNVYCLDKGGRMLWTKKTNSPNYTLYVNQETIIWDDMIFCATLDGKIFAIDLEGNISWSFTTKGSYITTAKIHAGVLYFGSQDRYIYAIDCKTKKVLWTFPCKDTGYVHSVTSERVFCSSRDHNIYVLNPKTGALRWKFATSGMVWGAGYPPSGGVVYFGGNDNHVYALDEKTGSLLWKFKTKGPVWHPPAVHEGKIYFGSYDCNFYCLNLKGELQWKFPTSMSSPAPIDTGEAAAAATLSRVVGQQEKEEEKDRYKTEFGDQGGPTSQYIVKSKYVVESKYTKQRKIKSMSSGWED